MRHGVNSKGNMVVKITFSTFKFSLLALLAISWVTVSQRASAQEFDLDKRQEKVTNAANATNTPSGATIYYANTDHIPKLDVIIPVFDPNIPDKDKKEVWPEVRRAEANRFALMLKQALEKSNAFGAVRVTPDQSGFGELYVHGKILKANGEDVKLEISVNDIRGPRHSLLKNKKFEYRVQESFHTSPRTRGTDAYMPIFDEIAVEIVRKLSSLSKKKVKELNGLSALTEMRFANMFGPEYFGKYLKEKKSSVTLAGFPSENDPVYEKIRTMRIQEQLFVDQLQPHYENFAYSMNPHYYAWQEFALPFAKEKRKAKAAATWKTIGAIAIAGAGVASGSNKLMTTGLVVGGVLIASSISDYRSKNESSKALDEMGDTLNLDMGTQVVEFEGVQTRLEGDAVEQFQGYRMHLVDIYEREATPDILISD